MGSTHSAEPSREEVEEAMAHPYVKFVMEMNITHCYKIMLFQGNWKIEKYTGVAANPEYDTLRREFKSKHPAILKMLSDQPRGDCVIQ